MDLPYLNIALAPVLKAVYRPSLLRPHISLKSIRDIDAEFLKSRGIQAVILDLDQTLCLHGQDVIFSPYLAAFTNIINAFRTCILTNPPQSHLGKAAIMRYQRISEAYGVQVIPSVVKKPHEAPFRQAMQLMGSEPRNTAMIGDRLLTDVLGANLCGILSILVDPISFENEPTALIKWLRHAETFILKILHLTAKPGS